MYVHLAVRWGCPNIFVRLPWLHLSFIASVWTTLRFYKLLLLQV